ncbi:hypothetical protein GGR33_002245 [Methylobacterium brachythecii]|uniref:Uncharacterized protein n=1 Tax=Methylobacterium brachythecii TaxID=1176177 RepID=A0A7W6F6W5_9HYPH|nr:hypothetical protein [Methylobacterium brachythecii]GLS42592.1 hypothetical protein GCM10007884_05770 [Methylobacterium brachythecii]
MARSRQAAPANEASAHTISDMPACAEVGGVASMCRDETARVVPGRLVIGEVQAHIVRDVYSVVDVKKVFRH